MTAQAAPPTVVYLEDFEDTANTALLLTDYQGAAPAQNQTYTAAPGWLRDCNGWVLTGASPQPADTRNCDAFWPNLQTLARSLGTLQGLPDPNTNHAVAGYTNNCGDPTSPEVGTAQVCGGANQVQWETESPITVPANRFYTFSVDASYTGCHVAHPLFDFSIVAGGTEIPTSPTPIDGCAQGNGAYSFASPGSIFVTSTSIGLRMRNRQGSTAGNDGAFDNIRLLDVTPVMHKSFGPAALNATAPSTLTFTIENSDELTAKNGWSFTDNLSAGLVVANPSGASTTCSSGQVTASAGGSSIAMTGNLDAGQASCTVTVNVTSPTAGTFTNCPANVTTVGIDPPACATVVFRAADVEIVKSTSEPVVPGDEATYTLTMTNNGPDTAVNPVASDPLPGGLTFVSAGDGCSEAGRTVTCTTPSLAAGAAKKFTVTARAGADARCADLQNTVTVTSDTFDPNMGNNSSTVRNCERRSDLRITKDASTAVVTTGGQVIYTVVVENRGASDDSNVTVTDAMAAGLSLVSADPSQGTCSIEGGRVSCELGDLKAGGSAQILVTATMTAPGAVGAGASCDPTNTITNTATVGGDAFDSNPNDNRDGAQVCPTPDPTPRFDLVVSKTVNDRTLLVGQAALYRVVVRNNGPDAARNVTLTDTLNAPVRVVSVRSTQGSCQRRIPMRCELGEIAGGASVTITIRAEHREAGCSPRQRNAASATGSGTEINPADNMDTVDVCVRKIPRLKLTKIANREVVSAGDTFSYRIRVRNPSEGQATSVSVCDRLPSGLQYRSSKPAAERSGRRRCWTIERLGARQSKTFRVTVRAARGAHGRLTNTATVSSPDVSQRARARDRVQVLGVATPVTG